MAVRAPEAPRLRSEQGPQLASGQARRLRSGSHTPLRGSSLAAGALLLALAAGFGAFAAARRGPAAPGHPPLVQIEEGGFRFVYHPPSGVSALYDLRADPACRENVEGAHPDVASRLRGSLERKLGVTSLSILGEPYRDERDALRRLGYL